MRLGIFLLLFVIGSATLAAQFYEWVDEKGIKQYTQQPPPPNIKNVQLRRLGTNVVETSGPSYSLQLATKNFPVTLYVTDCGDVCEIARAHLVKRGIPHSEKNPQKDEELPSSIKVTDGRTAIPSLVVGQLKTVKGYETSEWDAALDAAGYPSTAVPSAKPVVTPPPAKPEVTTVPLAK